AAVMYENMVIESYDRKKYKPPFPVVAIYPSEGTFVSDHPVGVVNRPWVTEAHRAAAKKYIDFLMEPRQQLAANRYGFRPGKEEVQLGPDNPLKKELGVNPNPPRKRLQVPRPEVLDAMLKRWQQHRKQMHVVMVFDTSGSMEASDRLTNAKLGAR